MSWLGECWDEGENQLSEEFEEVLFFFTQARSTSGFYTHVACWLFHQGFKVQVVGSSKSFSHQLLVSNWTIKKSLNFSGLTLCRAALKIDPLLSSFAQTTLRFISSHCLLTFPLPHIFLTNRNGDYRNCQVWLQAVKLTLEILPDCDAIDLNLGCPQVCHKKNQLIQLHQYVYCPGHRQKGSLWILPSRRMGIIRENAFDGHLCCGQTYHCQSEGVRVHGENGW